MERATPEKDNHIKDANHATSSNNQDDSNVTMTNGNISNQKKNSQKKITFNISGTKYSVVKNVGKDQMNWTLSNDESEWDIAWIDYLADPSLLSKLKPFQRINYFPGIQCLARKDLLAKNLSQLKRKFPRDYDFFPETYVLPTDYESFKTHTLRDRQATFIVKPKASSQGKGIFLTQTATNIDRTMSCIIQRYLNNPYLVDGLKFDMRIYVLLTHCDPLKIYLYNDGLVRFATEPYQTPCSENLNDVFMHLTNYAINKSNPNFIFNESAENHNIGHKRSLKAFFQNLEEQGHHNVGGLWNQIKKIIIRTFCSGQAYLAHGYKTYGNKKSPVSSCFQIFGFDIIFDQNFKPWLLEVNHSPSWTTDTPLDKTIKENVIRDAFDMLNISANDRMNYKKRMREEIQTRSFGEKVVKLKDEELKADFQKMQEELSRWEARMNLGGYEQIYPFEGTDLGESSSYQAFLDAAKEFWSTQGVLKDQSVKASKITVSNESEKSLPKTTTQKKIQYSSKPPPMVFGLSMKTLKNEALLKNNKDRLNAPNESVERDLVRAINGDEVEEYKSSDTLMASSYLDIYKAEDISVLEDNKQVLANKREVSSNLINTQTRTYSSEENTHYPESCSKAMEKSI